MLLGALQANQHLGEWAKWLRDSTTQPARVTREFLELCFANISADKHRSLHRRISCADERNIDAALYELVAHELFRRLHLNPKFAPKLSGPSPRSNLAPDLMVRVGGQDFIADVFLTNNPTRTIRPLSFLGLSDGSSFFREA